jgi:DNA-binding transcriptional MerR regulator
MNHAYNLGSADAFHRYGLKEASDRYFTEEDRLHRKMQRHMERGFSAEDARLMDKGERSGHATGRLLGGLGGMAAGGVIGNLGGPLAALGGGVLGGVAGFVGGGALGGSLGRDEGHREAVSREALAQRIKDQPTEEQRKHIQQLVNSQRQEAMLRAQRETASHLQAQRWDRILDSTYRY